MIFLDANVILRYLVQAPNAKSAAMSSAAKQLIQAVNRGEETVTTTEVVVHEVCYVLGSRKHYGMQAADIALLVSTLLQMPGFQFSRGEKQVYLEALDLLPSFPKLEFSDLVIAIRAQRAGRPLATFDKALARLPIVTPWQPEDHGQP